MPPHPRSTPLAPGHYRVKPGDFEVTALSDGTVALPVDKLLTNTTAAKSTKALARSFLKAPVDTSVNGYRINTGTQLVLIDSGAAGHPPGHRICGVESLGQKLVLWGALMHVAAVQFADPSVTIQFDTDSKNAAPQRQRACAEAAQQGYRVGSAHVSFPGLGHLRGEGKGCAWVPLNDSGLK